MLVSEGGGDLREFERDGVKQGEVEKRKKEGRKGMERGRVIERGKKCNMNRDSCVRRL